MVFCQDMNDMELKKIDDWVPEYWEGKTNLLIRLWTYAKRGLDIVNDFKYVGAGIFGVYFTLKLANPLWIAAMLLGGMPVLIVIGRWHLTRASKAQEFVTTVKGSVVGYSSYNLQVEQVALLKQILEKLNNGNKA